MGSFSLFLVWTFILLGRPQDFVPGMAELRPALVFGILAAAGALFDGRLAALGTLARTRTVRTYVLFYCLLLAGAPFALYRGQALLFLAVTYLSNMLFFFLLLLQVDTLKRLKGMLFVISASVCFYAGAALVQGQFLKGRFSAGTMYDPNDLAFFLVSLMPLGFFFVNGRQGAARRTVALLAVALGVAAAVFTGSRGGLLGLLVVAAMLLFTRRGNPLPAFGHKVVLVLIAIVLLLFSAHRINVERFRTLTELSTDYNLVTEDGRLTIWRRGLELVLAHPLLGVGADCFPQAIGELREKEGGSPQWQASHNAYLQIAAEAGIPAFVLFCLLAARTARSLSRSAVADTELASIAGAVRIGFLACLTTAVFLSQAYSVLFPLFFGLAPVLALLEQAGPAVAEGVVLHPAFATVRRELAGVAGIEDDTDISRGNP